MASVDSADWEVASPLPSTGYLAAHTKPDTALPCEADDSPLTTPQCVTMYPVMPATADGGGFEFTEILCVIVHFKGLMNYLGHFQDPIVIATLSN